MSLAAAVAWVGLRLARVLAVRQDETAKARTLSLLQTFAPALAAVEADPRLLLVWQPLATSARRLFPEEFTALDRAAGATFPFDKGRLEAAHARWTTEWLTWEGAHDAEYKGKAAAAEEELTRSHGSPILRARLDAIEREKLEHYQRRYAEYIRVAKALDALMR